MPQDRVQFAHVLRGVAAVSVVLFHYLGVFWAWPGVVAGLLNAPPPAAPVVNGFVSRIFAPGGVFSAGDFGVSLFFLISGFVVPFSLTRYTRLGFVVARAVRLWPTYAAGLTVTLIWLVVVTAAFGRVWPHGAGEIAWHYALGLRDVAGSPSLDGIVWTLEIEIRFYLLCVLLAPSLRAGRLAGPLVALGVLLAGTAAVDAFRGGGGAVSGSWTLATYLAGLDGQTLAYMLIGTLFYVHVRGHLTTRRLAVLVAVSFGGVAWIWSRGPLAAEFAAGVVSYGAALAVFAACYAWRSRIGGGGPLAWLADVSYPLYVVHAMPGYAIMRLRLAAGAAPWACIAMAGIWALGAAATLHFWVERPTQNWGRALAQRLSRPPRGDVKMAS